MMVLNWKKSVGLDGLYKIFQRCNMCKGYSSEVMKNKCFNKDETRRNICIISGGEWDLENVKKVENVISRNNVETHEIYQIYNDWKKIINYI